jgi:hypothetical protein
MAARFDFRATKPILAHKMTDVRDDRNLPATATPMPADRSAERPRSARRRVSDLHDKRTASWRRRVELIKVFEAALGGQVPPPPLRLRIEAAAEMTVIAERARAGFLAGSVALDDVVRVERAAASAVRTLRIGDRKPQAETLHDYLAAKAT